MKRSGRILILNYTSFALNEYPVQRNTKENEENMGNALSEKAKQLGLEPDFSNFGNRSPTPMTDGDSEYENNEKSGNCKNLIKNPSGYEKLEHWKVIWNKNRGIGNRVKVEAPPSWGLAKGADLPTGPQGDVIGSAFVTSYDWCSMQQTIDLWDVGYNSAKMEEMIPFQVTLSEIVGARFDCGGMYRIHFCLMSVENEILSEEMIQGTIKEGTGWKEVSSTLTVNDNLRDRIDDLRYVIVTNNGKDCKFWAGYYGIKFSRISVVIKEMREAESTESDNSVEE